LVSLPRMWRLDHIVASTSIPRIADFFSILLGDKDQPQTPCPFGVIGLPLRPFTPFLIRAKTAEQTFLFSHRGGRTTVECTVRWIVALRTASCQLFWPPLNGPNFERGAGKRESNFTLIGQFCDAGCLQISMCQGGAEVWRAMHRMARGGQRSVSTADVSTTSGRAGLPARRRSCTR
jgi:hypothetical protein